MVTWRSAAFALIVGTAWVPTIAPLSATQKAPVASEADTLTISNDSTSALFTASGLKPGDQATRDITVTYTGSAAPVAVRVYLAPGGLTGSGLDRYLHLTLERGRVPVEGSVVPFLGSPVFSGTLEDFARDHSSFSDGVALWTVNRPGEQQMYRFTITLLDDNRAQGLDATIAFTWEARVSEISH